jgi:hypothetical protein
VIDYHLPALLAVLTPAVYGEIDWPHDSEPLERTRRTFEFKHRSETPRAIRPESATARAESPSACRPDARWRPRLARVGRIDRST